MPTKVNENAGRKTEIVIRITLTMKIKRTDEGGGGSKDRIEVRRKGGERFVDLILLLKCWRRSGRKILLNTIKK